MRLPQLERLGLAGSIALLAVAATIFALFQIAHGAPSVTYPSNGGTGTSTTPGYGQLLIGGKSGEYEFVASSTFGGGGSSFSYLFPSNATSTTIKFSGGFLVTASSTFTTNPHLATASSLLKTDSTGLISGATNGTDYTLLTAFTCTSGDFVSALTASGGHTCSTPSGGGSAYPFSGSGNSTSTLTQFNGGLTAFASSTIGDGTAAGGLTVSGGATTTGNTFLSINGATAIGTSTNPHAAGLLVHANTAFAPDLEIGSLLPTSAFFQYGAGAFDAYWVSNVDSSHNLNFYSASDAYAFSTKTEWLKVVRGSTTAVTSVLFPNGNIGVASSTPNYLLSLGTGSSAASIDSSGNLRLNNLATASGSFLAVDGSGKVIATTTPAGGVTSVSNSDSSLTISPTTGDVVASLNTAHANTWTGLQQFNANASTTALTVTGNIYDPLSISNFVVLGTTTPSKGFGSIGEIPSPLTVVSPLLPIQNYTDIIPGAIVGATAGDSGVSGSNASGLTGYAANSENAYGILAAGIAGINRGVTGSPTFSGGIGAAVYANELNSFSANTLNYAIYALGGANYFQNNVGIGTTTPGSLLSIGNTAGINFAENATSTFSTGKGINLSGGCYAIAGTCIGAGSGTVTSVGLSSSNSTLTIGSTPITTSGTITADLNLGHANTWTALQTFANASTTQIGSTGNAYFATSGGNVGIGTTTPQYPLTAFSSSGPQLSLSAGAGLSQWVARVAGGNLYIASTTTSGTATTSTAAIEVQNNATTTFRNKNGFDFNSGSHGMRIIPGGTTTLEFY